MHPWREINEFKDRATPALFRLAEESRAGRNVPPTMWAPATEMHGPPWNFGPWPLVLRIADGSADHDTHGPEMLIAHHPGEFRRLYDALAAAHPRGTIWVQAATATDRLLEHG